MAITTIGTNGIADNIITGAKVALASQAAGDVMYYNGTDWIRVAIGTDGQVLTVNNAENAPGWEAGGAPLTPWTENIDADTFTLTDVGATGNNWNSTALTVQSTTNAKLRLVIGSGDASIVFEGPTNWVVGLDNSASDQFVIGNDTALGTDDSLRITTAGAITIKENNSYPSVTKGIAKAWMKNSGATTPVVEDSYNCTLTDSGVGYRTYTFGDDFENDDYVCVGNAYGPAGNYFQGCIFGQNTLAVGSVDCLVRTTESAANVDVPNAVAFFGEAT